MSWAGFIGRCEGISCCWRMCSCEGRFGLRYPSPTAAATRRAFRHWRAARHPPSRDHPKLLSVDGGARARVTSVCSLTGLRAKMDALLAALVALMALAAAMAAVLSTLSKAAIFALLAIAPCVYRYRKRIYVIWMTLPRDLTWVQFKLSLPCHFSFKVPLYFITIAVRIDAIDFFLEDRSVQDVNKRV